MRGNRASGIVERYEPRHSFTRRAMTRRMFLAVLSCRSPGPWGGADVWRSTFVGAARGPVGGSVAGEWSGRLLADVRRRRRRLGSRRAPEPSGGRPAAGRHRREPRRRVGRDDCGGRPLAPGDAAGAAGVGGHLFGRVYCAPTTSRDALTATESCRSTTDTSLRPRGRLPPIRSGRRCWSDRVLWGWYSASRMCSCYIWCFRTGE